MSERKIIDIPFWTMCKAVLVVVLFWVLWQLRDIIAIILLSIVIASSIEPLNHWFARHRIPRVLGVIFVYLFAFSIFFLVFYLVIPPLLSEIVNFISTLPDFIEKVFRPDSILFSMFPEYPAVLGDVLRSVALSLENSVENYLAIITNGIFSAGSTLLGGVFSFIMLMVISFYLSVQEHGIENFLRIVTPIEYEPYILDLWVRSQRKIGRWLQGQILLAVLVGIMVFLGLVLLNVQHAPMLALLSAVFEIIPFFGPIMAAIPAVAIASLQSPTLGLMVLVLYIFVQQMENHLIYPLVVRKTVGVPPLLVVIALVVGLSLGGFFGFILAVPIAAVLVEFLRDVAARKYPKASE